MASLMSMEQKKEESTHDFICRFEAELDKVDSYDESWVLRMFIWGLSQDQAVLVSQGKPTRLDQAFQLARDAALAAQMARRPGTSGTQEGSSSQKGQGRGQGKSTRQHRGQGRVRHHTQHTRRRGIMCRKGVKIVAGGNLVGLPSHHSQCRCETACTTTGKWFWTEGTECRKPEEAPGSSQGCPG